MYYPSSYIRFVTLDDQVVVLDIRTGRYLVFDPVASYIWNNLFIGAAHQKCVDDISARFSADRSRCEHDLDAFVKDCCERGLIALEPDEGPSLRDVMHQHPHPLSAWKCLFRTWYSLKRCGFSSTYETHLRMVRPNGSTSAELADLPAAVNAFRRAENFFPMRGAPNDCLPRSLALHKFLLAAGFDAHHCIGVRRFPFAAHAWVEVSRMLVCDTETFVNQFTEIART